MSLLRLERNRLPDLRLALGMTLPAAAGLAAFGWRAIGVFVLVATGALISHALLKRLRLSPSRATRLTILVQSALLTLFLPATLFDIDASLLRPEAHWPVPLALGVILATCTWLIGRLGTPRVSPLVLTLLLCALISPTMLRIDRVLQRDQLVTGDLLDIRVANRGTSAAEPWMAAPLLPNTVALVTPPAGRRLDEFLHGRAPLERGGWTIPRIVSDDLPPLEDLVIIGHPRRIGAASAIAVLIGGLFLVHRRVAAFRVPMLMIFATMLTLIVIRMPILVTPGETVYRWLAPADPRVGWAAGITFVNYLLIASPTLLVLFFIAMQPGVRPLGTRAGLVYAILFGILCGTLMVMVSFGHGAIIAVAIAQLLTPTLDRLLPAKA